MESFLLRFGSSIVSTFREPTVSRCLPALRKAYHFRCERLTVPPGQANAYPKLTKPRFSGNGWQSEEGKSNSVSCLSSAGPD